MEGAAAYRQLTTPENGLSRSARHWGGIEAQKRAQERADIKSNLDNYDKTTKKDLESFSSSISGNRSLDEIWTKMAEDSEVKYVNYVRKAKDLLAQGKRGEARDYQNKAQNILSSFSRAKQTTDQIGKNVAGYIEAVKNGQVNPLERRYPMIVEAIAKGQYDFVYDDSDRLMAKVYSKDENGDLKEEWLDPTELARGDIGYGASFNSVSTAENIAKNLGIATIDKDTGTLIRTTKNLDESGLKKLDLEIYTILEDPNKMSQALYQASGGNIEKLSDFTSSDNKIVKEYLKDLTLGTINTEDKLKADPSENLKLGWARLANDKDKEQYRRKAKEKELTTLEPKTDADGNLLITDEFKPKTGSLSKNYEFSLGGQGFSITGDPRERINSIFIDEDGNMAYRGLLKVEKNPKRGIFSNPLDKKKKEYVYEEQTIEGVEPQRANTIARKILNPETGEKFKDYSELVKFTLKSAKVDKQENRMSDDEFNNFLKKNGL